MSDETQAMPVAEVAELERSIAQLGPRKTTHGTGNVAVDVPPKFDEWVARWVADHIPVAMEKAQTYGSNSLAKKGHRLAAAGQRDLASLGQALELGVAQYLAEKADRVEDSILRGRFPGADTYTDLAIYALMALYIRQHGSW